MVAGKSQTGLSPNELQPLQFISTRLQFIQTEPACSGDTKRLWPESLMAENGPGCLSRLFVRFHHPQKPTRGEV